jgi:hypothetical protein
MPHATALVHIAVTSASTAIYSTLSRRLPVSARGGAVFLPAAPVDNGMPQLRDFEKKYFKLKLCCVVNRQRLKQATTVYHSSYCKYNKQWQQWQIQDGSRLRRALIYSGLIIVKKKFRIFSRFSDYLSR